MSFLKKIFQPKSTSIKTYADFWTWFQQYEREFFTAVKTGKNIETKFFDKLSESLGKLNDGYFYLTGMHDDNNVELVLTADGNTKHIVFVEELVAAAPKIEGWMITALKPPIDINVVSIEMGDHKFNAKNLSFYSNELAEYPDEIDITVVHDDLTAENQKEIVNGTYIFLDNYLGELDFLTNIDNLTILGRKEAKSDLIPIDKLKDFLNWRKREFIEKYEEIRYNTANDNYSVLEAKLADGNPLVAVINDGLLSWDSKASHPWIAMMTLKFNDKDNDGMPGNNDYQLLDQIEHEILEALKDIDGYLNIGRQTANGERDIYFACKDFRMPSKIFFRVEQDYADKFGIEYEIYKDKYWQSFEKFHHG